MEKCILCTLFLHLDRTIHFFELVNFIFSFELFQKHMISVRFFLFISFLYIISTNAATIRQTVLIRDFWPKDPSTGKCLVKSPFLTCGQGFPNSGIRSTDNIILSI